MGSRIEQLIDDIEDYVETCKTQTFNSSRIIVNKDELMHLITELRKKTPDEIKRYQRIIQNKEEILNEARKKAEQLINEATIQTTELISEHEIMQQAYAEANEVLTRAQAQAQELLDTAMMEANGMKSAATQYTDELLAFVEEVIAQTISTVTANQESLVSSLKQYQDIIQGNRRELYPQTQLAEEDLYDYDGSTSSSGDDDGDGIADLDII